MTTIAEQICTLATAVGATYARVIGAKRLQAHAHVLASCADNACGRYGRCWACPPTLGTLEELAEWLTAYPSGVLVQNITTLEDSWDFEGMTKAAQAHNAMMRELARQAAARFPACVLLPLGCGGCGYCARCTCPDDPCAFPEQALASVEGYGMDVKALVESCGLHYINGANTVSYVGAVLLQRSPG